jgi:hypothetical protein
MMRINKGFSLAFLLGLALFLGRGSPARGDFEVIFSYNGATITLDGTTQQTTATGGASLGGALIDYSTPGTISISNLTISTTGTSGGFRVSATVADSNSPGSGTAATIDLSSLSIQNRSSAQGTLTITTSDTGFTAPTGQLSLMSTISATAAGTNKASAQVTFNSSVSFANSTFGTPQINLSPITPGSSLSGNSALVVNVTSTPYTLSQVEAVTLGAGDKLTDGSTGTTLIVPAPSGLTLLLCGLPCLGIGLWRRFRKPT